MRKKAVIFIITALIVTGSCGQMSVKDNISSNEIIDGFLDKENFGNQENPLFGKTYRNIEDIPELHHWKDLGGSVIESSEDANGEFRFGIGLFEDTNGNRVCTFEEFSNRDEQGKVKYKILDTINIGKLKDNELLTFCNCQRDTILDNEIIAVVIYAENQWIYDKIVRAWRADTKTGKLLPINDLQGIYCIEYGDPSEDDE